jgi:hypothetical protein
LKRSPSLPESALPIVLQRPVDNFTSIKSPAHLRQRYTTQQSLSRSPRWETATGQIHTRMTATDLPNGTRMAELKILQHIEQHDSSMTAMHPPETAIGLANEARTINLNILPMNINSRAVGAVHGSLILLDHHLTPSSTEILIRAASTRKHQFGRLNSQSGLEIDISTELTRATE